MYKTGRPCYRSSLVPPGGKRENTRTTKPAKVSILLMKTSSHAMNVS